MRRKLSRKWRSTLVFLLFVGALSAWVMLTGNHSDFSEKYQDEDLSRIVIGIGRQNTYAMYLQRF